MILDLQKYNKIVQDGKEVTLIQQGTSRVYIDLNEIVEFTDPVIKEMCIKFINDAGHEVYLKDEIRQAELSYIIDSIDDIYVFANDDKWSEVRSLRDLRHFPNLQELIIDEEGLFDHINEIDLKHIFVIGGYAFTNHPGIKFYGEDNLIGIGEGCLENATILNDKFNATGLTDDDIEEGTFRNVTMNDIVLTNVSNIPSYFFEGAKFKVLHIGDSCDTISEYAFYKSDFDYIANALAITYIGYSAFEDSKTHMIVDFPDLQEVGFYAFKNCVNIEEVRNLGSVWEITEQLFSGCFSLCRINFGEIISTIRQEAFLGCHSLKVVDLPETVFTVETHAFYNCAELTIVESMGSLDSFTEAIFENCKNLQRVHFPNNIDNYKIKAFVNCPKLRVLSNIYNYDELDACFENCPKVDTVWLGKDMTEIEADKLNTNKFIKIIRFNEKLESIQDEALSNLPNLHTIDVSAYLIRECYMTSFENINHDISIWNAFLMDSSINTSNLATTIKTLHTYDISLGAYSNDNNTISIPLRNQLETIENIYVNAKEFISLNGELFTNWKPKNVYIGNNITSINATSQMGSQLEKCYIGSDVSIITSGCFSGISTLVELNFEKATSLICIELGAINGNSNLKALYLPPNIKTIYGGTICGNYNLSKIVFYDGFEHLSGGSLSGNNSNNGLIDHIKFPKTLRCVSTGCIGSHFGYDTIEFHKDSSVTFYQAFATIGALNNLILPDKMDVSSGWLNTADGTVVNAINIYNYNANTSIGYAFPTVEKLEIGEYMTDMPNNFALNCTSLNTVTVKSEHITSIPSSAFYNCNSLHTLDISTAITYVGSSAFYNCAKLMDFNFKDVSYIGNYAFFNNSKLETDLISENIEYIGERAFLSTRNIPNIDLPNITTIGSGAFYQASVKNVSFGDKIDYLPGNIFEDCNYRTFFSFYGPNIKTIGAHAFRHSYILNVSVSPECRNIEEYAFYNCSKLKNITDTSGNNIFNIVEYIGTNAFGDLLDNFINSFIVDEANIKTINSSAFVNTNIKTISITNAPLTRIENHAFYTYENKSVNLENLPLEYIGDYAFYYATQDTLELHDMPLKSIGTYAFSYGNIQTVRLYNIPLLTLTDRSFYSSKINNFYANDTSLVKIGQGVLYNSTLKIFDISDSCGNTGLVLDNSIFAYGTSYIGNNYLHTINLRNSGVSSINSSTFWWQYNYATTSYYKNAPVEIDLRGLKNDCVIKSYAFTSSDYPTTSSSLDVSIYFDEDSHIVEIENTAFKNMRLLFEKDIYDPETGVLDLSKLKYLKKFNTYYTLNFNGNNYSGGSYIRTNFGTLQKLILGESVEEFTYSSNGLVRSLDLSRTKIKNMPQLFGVNEIILPKTVTTIPRIWLEQNGGGYGGYVTGLIDFPETVTSFGFYALANNGMEILIFRNPTPATLNYENANRMYTRLGFMAQLKEIYVPDSAVETYKNDAVWGNQWTKSNTEDLEGVNGNKQFKNIIYPLSAYYAKYGEEGWKPGMEI